MPEIEEGGHIEWLVRSCARAQFFARLESYRIRKWASSVVKMEQPAVAAYVRLQLQNMTDESRGTTQTCRARSIERTLRSGCARVVKVREFLLPQTTGWDVKLHARGYESQTFAA